MHLETPGHRVLDLHGKPLTEYELEQQKHKVGKGPLVVQDREHSFTEDLIVDEAGVTDPKLSLLTKVTPLVQALQSGGSYALVEKLWSQFDLTDGNINVEVVWNRDEVLVSSVRSPESLRLLPDLQCCFAFSQSL